MTDDKKLRILKYQYLDVPYTELEQEVPMLLWAPYSDGELKLLKWLHEEGGKNVWRLP